jgi:hypothetical protein
MPVDDHHAATPVTQDDLGRRLQELAHSGFEIFEPPPPLELSWDVHAKLSEAGHRRAELEEARMQRERQVLHELAEVRRFAEAGERRASAAEARASAAETRERFMVKLTVASAVFGCIGAGAAVVAIL